MEEITLGLSVLFFAFCLFDAIVYGKAKYPDRCKWYFKEIPGGGIWAYFKFKKNL